MANLSEQESWIDGIYQLETSDPVVAGPGGISNRQAEQLASRTAYLKKMQETTGESLQKHLAASDPHSQYAPKNSPALTGTPTAPTTAQTANNTQIATTAFVKSALAALVNGSPAALDTLQELANALGNDPHFSTTVLNAIADVKTDVANKLNAHASTLDAHPQYAPKASPTFTGTPTAPTAASGSNDTQLATTAFVKAAVAALVNGSPAALDTLQELASALGNDPNFSTTMLNAIAGKLAKDQNGADIPDKSQFRNNIGLGNAMLRGDYGLGGNAISIPANTDINAFFNTAPSGIYAGHDGGYLNIPPGDISYLFFWMPTLNNVYGVLKCLGLNSQREYYRHRLNGQWLDWHEIYSTQRKPTANDVGAFQLGFADTVNNTDVAWNDNSGIYNALKDSYSQMIVHFNGGAGSCPSLQFLASYGNGGLAYRTARDDYGFEHDWEAFYTTKFKPTANDVGALALSGGVMSNGMKIGGNVGVAMPVDMAIVGMLSNDNYRQMMALAGDDTIVIGNRTSKLGIVSRDEIYFRNNDNGVWYTVYHTGNLTPQTIGALPTSELVGMPQLFPSAVAPSGWLKCNGQQFDTAQFPVLASRYPSGFLPDLRGEFVRGWDDGRGADSGRALLSAQGDAIRNITGKFNPGGNGSSGDSALFTAGPWGQASSSGAFHDSALITFDASKVVPTANENRPRNIAFNYIVRAA